MRRDRMTFGMMIGVPMIQLILFGYAINSDPKHLPTAVYSQDKAFSRAHRVGNAQQQLLQHHHEPKNEAEINKLLAKTTVQFVVTSPWIFRANCCAAKNPICCLKRMPPTRRPLVTRSRR